MKNKLPHICYWCGIGLTEETNNKEHVPPYGFFPKGFRENLITVPSCVEHNNQFSSLDERFQIYIKALGTNQIAIDDFKDRTVRSLNRENCKKFVKNLSDKSFYTEIDGEQKLVMEIDIEYSQKFIEKIVRGIYFYHNKIPAEGLVQGFSPQLINPTINYEELADYLLEDLTPDIMIRGNYNNPDVFKYTYFELPESRIFITVINFYKGTQFIGWVIPKNYTPSL